MATPESIQQQIEALNDAIRSGEHSVSFNGRTVTYRTVADLIKARDDARAELVTLANRRRRSYHFNFKTLRGD
ncbi:hypothetical protein [Paracidovorax wautersii]|uniref:phage head-tail joining protein n=1 Tax=Paracidovorax wautersii TaxID=1177982 RepID=UPI0031E04B01